MIGVVGEILVDMIGQNHSGKTAYTRYAGGAPFNLACAAKKLGADVVFSGVVGKDIMGEFLLESLKKEDLDPAYTRVEEESNTTLAFVSHSENGERSFCFYRKRTADDAFIRPLPLIFQKANILHFGTLMLSSSKGREFIKLEAKEAKKRGQMISMDVNYREDIFHSQEEALNIYHNILPLADILKFSEDEVKLFGEDYVASFPQKIVLITLGAKGSKLLYGGNSYFAPSLKIEPLDTTGAGDAFFGAFLSQIDGKKITNLTQKEIERILRFSNVVASLNTMKFGAIDGLPSLEEVERKIEEIQ